MAEKDLDNLIEADDPEDLVDDLEDLEEIEDIDEATLDEDLEEDLDEALPADLGEEEFDEEEESDDEYDEDEEDEEHDEETAEALEELENQQLQLLDDEANEAMLVDEVAELRAMRREELTLNVDAQSQKADEFVCQSCFMVKRTSQLANKRKMICFDCVD
jgi:hypothetical protein